MNKVISQSFLWMFVGLMVTFLTGYVVSMNANMIQSVFSPAMLIVLVLIELGLAIFFIARLRKMSPTSAKICFLLYSFVSGLTFSSIFIEYKLTSIIFVFGIAAVVFLIFGAIGYFLNIDLSKLGVILFMGILAVILYGILNIFIKSSAFNLGIVILSLLVFFGYTAYDVQKIKNTLMTEMDPDVVAIYGAFELYLDFINIFINLLKLIGDAKD